MWKFREIPSIEEPIFNNTLEKFYNIGIEGLVRENIQNSLDAKIPESDLPVEVIIETGIIKDEDVPGMEEVRKHITSLKGENEYTNETIAHMQKEMQKTEVPYLSFEDCNTKGLTGAEHGEAVQEGDTWGVYAYKKGVHFVEEDRNIENVRGGSYGVGKIACNAASDIYMMIFSNCDQEGKKHIGGTIQLIEHNLDHVNFRASGYLTREIQNVYYPFQNNVENGFSSVFQKNTRGLKIVIPYLRKQYLGVENVVHAVCDNFFIAILEKKLVVRVNDIEINDKEIQDIIRDERFYKEQNPSEIKKDFTLLYVDTYIKKKPILIEVEDKKKKYNFKLFLQYSKNIKRARVAIVRDIGMKIEDKKVSSYVKAPFNGVLLPVSSTEDMFLKSLENESHTNLSSEHIKDVETQKNAKRFLNNINKKLGEKFNEILKKENPSNGEIDTSEVIYSMEGSFRRELSKRISTVQLTKGNEKGQKNLVKIKTNSRKNQQQEGEEQTSQQQEKDKEKINRRKKIIRRVRKKDGEDSEKQRVRYLMYPECVKRVVLNKKERLMFDFNNVKQYEGETSCDISMGVVDGIGKTYETEFDINKNYSVIFDKGKNGRCQVEKNIIKDVSIVDGKVNLEMQTAETFNDSLKFIYYVEV